MLSFYPGNFGIHLYTGTSVAQEIQFHFDNANSTQIEKPEFDEAFNKAVARLTALKDRQYNK